MVHAEFQNLASALKKIMKAKKLRYSTLAKRLNVSEATVKRFFTSSDGSLGRIVEICEVLGITFADLVEQATSQKEQVFELTYEQEEFFASHPHYYYFFRELVEEGLSFQEIKAKHKLSQQSLAKYLRKLERMELVHWLPQDKIRLRVKGTHNWLDDGPLQLKFVHAENDSFLGFMLKDHQDDSRYLTTSDRYAHPDTLKAIISELKPLFSAFRKRVYRDEVFYPKDELIPVKWLMAIGPFQKPHPGRIENI